MTDIYRQHDAAFANVSAYIVVKNGERIAKVAFKYPRDGAGRLYAYVHVFGTEMVRGFASGYGYDKASAAVYDACGKIKAPGLGWVGDADCIAIKGAILSSNGSGNWDGELRNAGYDVWQVV